MVDNEVTPGTSVEVRSRFNHGWTRGFDVEERLDGTLGTQYTLRRRSDGEILPIRFDENDLRKDRD